MDESSTQLIYRDEAGISKIHLYTQSNVYMKKTSSLLILALLTASALLAFIPVAVHGSTGNIHLGTLNNKTAAAVYTGATSFVGVRAGSDAATNDANTPLTDFFAVNFNSVTFSGAQFYLYLSKDGLSSISAGDLKYAGPFLVANFSLAFPNKSPQANGTFWEGVTLLGAKVLEGPLPTKISSDYKYVKVFDGSATAISVSSETISVNPGLTLSPTSGPAGVTVTASGADSHLRRP